MAMATQIHGVSLPDELFEVRDVPVRLIHTASRRAQLLRLAARGINAKDAALMVGVNPQTARGIYADPRFRQDVQKLIDNAFEGVDSNWARKKKTMHERLEEVADRSFEILETMLEDAATPKPLRTRIAQDFLDRNPETQAGFKTQTTIIDANMLTLAARTAKEMDKAVVDVTKEK